MPAHLKNTTAKELKKSRSQKSRAVITAGILALLHGRLSRRQLTAQRQAEGLLCTDDYEKSVTVTSHIVFLSLKMSIQYSARTGRD